MTAWPPVVHQDVTDEINLILTNFLDRTTVQSAVINTAEAVASTTYADPATVGPSVTLDVPSSGSILVIVTSFMSPGSGTDTSLVAVALSGANTRAAADSEAVRTYGLTPIRGSSVTRLTGLTPGSTTVKMRYRSTGGTSCTYDQRALTVIPL